MHSDYMSPRRRNIKTPCYGVRDGPTAGAETGRSCFLTVHTLVSGSTKPVVAMSSEKKDEKLSITMGIGAALGAGVGTAVGVALGNIAVGLAVGVGVGIALAAAVGQRR